MNLYQQKFLQVMEGVVPLFIVLGRACNNLITLDIYLANILLRVGRAHDHPGLHLATLLKTPSMRTH